jgi:hypothetical protein
MAARKDRKVKPFLAERDCQICTRPRGHLDPGSERCIRDCVENHLDAARYKVLNDAHAKDAPRLRGTGVPTGCVDARKNVFCMDKEPCSEGGEV